MEKVRLCDVCDFQGGSQPPKNEWSFEQKDGYIRMLQIRDFTQTRNVEKEYIKLTSSTKTCVTEDILIARYGASIGKILTGLSGAYNVAIMKTIPNEGILNKSYLKYYLLSNYFQNGINSVGARAAQAGFNKEDLSKLYIPVVSLVQQKLIVDKLNKLTALIDKRKKQLKKFDELVKSRFIEMFGDCDLTEQKKEWKAVREVGTVVGGSTPKTSVAGYWNGEYRWLSPAELEQDSGVIFDSVKKITKAGIESCSLQELPVGTVILSSRAPIGKLAIAGNTFYCNQGFKNIVCNERIVPRYLYSLLLFNTEYLNSLGRGATFKEISKSIVENIKIPVPPIDLQNEFAKFVAKTDKSKFEIKQSLEKLELLKKALMQKYFG